MNKLPILLLDNFFLFPKCKSCLPLDGSNHHLRKIFLRICKDYQGQFLVVFGKEKSVPIGVLAKVDLGDISSEADLELIINSFKEIRLEGLERVKVINMEEENEILKGEYQLLLEKEVDEKTIDELTEKFVRHIPNVLEKVKLNSVEKLPYMTMMRGNIGNLIDFIAQNSREIDQLTRWKILVSLDLRERLEILINLPDRQKIDKEIEEKTREKMRDENEKYYLQKKLEAIERRLREKGIHGSSEIRRYLEKLKEGEYPANVKRVIQQEIERYETMPSNFSEVNIIKQYID